MVQGWLAMLGLMLACGLVLAARAEWRRGGPIAPISPAPARKVAPVAVPSPGIMAAGDGSTGTVDLPALPIPPGAVITDSGVVPARPFRWGPATAIDRARAMQCLTAAIYYEANGEGIDGERAVAQVVLNRARHPAFPASVCGVVYQGVERARCQFSFVCDGALSRPPSIAGWTRAARIAAAALSGGVYAPVGLATHYHTFAVTPAWNRAMVMTDMVGAHLFHRWKGYWGSAAAMNRAYAGGEILPILPPAPSASSRAVETGALPPMPPALAVPPLPTGQVVAPPVAPVAVTSASPIGGTASLPKAVEADDTIINDRWKHSGEILDKWKDSGRPIRRPD
ncbi:cell wall hydrolase [Sphingomonas sp.]|uniref:cell wall hydrolase n=1 Tax=Sphingomonas sp. TaxID=28214 RepID=UPI0031CF804D